jgi:small-conductance mechanosensitive channel
MKKTPVYIWLLILFLTWLVSLVTTTLLFTLGLVLIEFLLYPLALGVSALLTGLTAVWLGNKLIHDGLQTPVEAVVKWCEGTAVLLSLILIASKVLNLGYVRPIVISSLAAAILALTAVYSVRQHRSALPKERSMTRQAVTWLIVALLAIPLVIFLASIFGWAGA